MSVLHFDPDNWGYIKKVTTGFSTTYTAYDEGVDGPGIVPRFGIDRTGDPTEYRAYFSFDTSSMPAGSRILQVDFYLEVDSNFQSGTQPDDWKTIWNIKANHIGAAVTTDDWGGMVYAKSRDWATVPTSGNQTMSTSSTVLDEVDPDGYTDFELRDDSDFSADEAWWTQVDTGRTYIEVTFAPLVMLIT